MTLTLRSASTSVATTKGAPLTHAEMDANWLHGLQSANQSFLQSGSGAVAEAVQDALRRLVHTAQYDTQGNYETARDALTGTFGMANLDITGDILATDQSANHAIGGTAKSNVFLRIGTGDGAAHADPSGIFYNGVITGVVGAPSYGLIVATNFTKAASGTHTNLVGIEADFPHISGSGATVTNQIAIHVGNDGAPSGATNAYAIWVKNGKCMFAGTPATVAEPGVGLLNQNMISWQDAAAGYTNAGFIYLDSSNRLGFGAGNTARMYVHPAGAVSIGTAVVTGAGAGEAVLANDAGLRGVDAAGTATLQIAKINSADRIEIGTTANNIQLMKPLVALGGGAAATLGTIAGSGPGTATQNTWMEFNDNNGAQFWVPVWK